MKPPLRREVRLAPDAGHLFLEAAAVFAQAAEDSVAAKGSFDIALAGGSTPRPLFAVLVSTPEFRNRIAWDKVRFFWGDERPVGPDHPENNYRMAHEALLAHLPVREDRIFRIHGELADAAKAAAGYDAVLRREFRIATGFPRFDLILLGMGPDGHTASLFPGTRALRERRRLAVSNWVGKLFSHRITLTAPVLNAGARVMFLVAGPDKAPALKAVLEGPYEPDQLPAQLVRPRCGKLLWLVDAAAGHLLDPATAVRT